MAYTVKRRRAMRQQVPAKECCPYGRAAARQAQARRRKKRLVHVGHGKFILVEDVAT